MSEFSNALAQRAARLAALETRFSALGRGETKTKDGVAATSYDFRSGTARDTVSDSEIAPMNGQPVSPPFITWRCESLTGTALICGFSGFNDGSYNGTSPTTQANWEGQYRKWQKNTMSGLMTVINYSGAGCTGTTVCYDPGPPLIFGTTVTWASSATLDCDGRTDGAVSVSGFTNTSCDGATTTFYAYTVRQNEPEGGNGITYERTLTTQTLTGIGCVADTRPGSGRASFKLEGDATDTLSDEQFLYDALQAVLTLGGDVEVGESCCAALSEGELTTPESQSPITMTGTAVRVRVTVFGVPLAEYEVAIEITRGASVFTVLVAARGMVPTDFNVPLAGPGTDPYCVTDVYLP